MTINLVGKSGNLTGSMTGCDAKINYLYLAVHRLSHMHTRESVRSLLSLGRTLGRCKLASLSIFVDARMSGSVQARQAGGQLKCEPESLPDAR